MNATRFTAALTASGFALLACSALAQQPAKPGKDTATATQEITQSMSSSPQDGGVRRWQVNSQNGVSVLKSPAIVADVVYRLDDAAIVANLGCASTDDQLWCKVRPIQGRTVGYVVARFLQPAVGPDGLLPMGTDDSAARAGEADFDVQSTIACAQEKGQQMSRCQIGISRGTGGDATAVVTFANGFNRTLYFAHGMFIRANATMSGAGFDTDWKIAGGAHHIRVDDQQYVIADTDILGP